MAKCDFCGKDVAFGIKVSHSHRSLQPYLEAQHQAGEGGCQRHSQARVRLHPLLAFRQSDPSCLSNCPKSIQRLRNKGSSIRMAPFSLPFFFFY